MEIKSTPKLLVSVTTSTESFSGSGEWTVESYKIIDHNNSSDRKWLGTHCFWAFRNGRKVETYPL